MDIDEIGQQRTGPSFRLVRFILAVLVGFVVGYRLLQPLVLIRPFVELALLVCIALATGLLVGGWSLCWGRFPVARVGGLGGLVALAILTAYAAHPPSSRVALPQLKNHAAFIDDKQLSICGVAPAMTWKQVRASLGSPDRTGLKSRSIEGMAVSYTSSVYQSQQLEVLSLQGRVAKAIGSRLALKGVTIVSRGDPREKTRALLGIPTTALSSEAADVYSLRHPRVVVRYDKDRVAAIELGEI
jgi:hypothetical protein